MSTLQWLMPNSFDFPPLNSALTEPNGLLAIGGDLSSERLIQAYQHGIFPWFNEGEEILWWSPTPRAIINVNSLRINKTLKKFLKKELYTVSINTCFDRVMDYCANALFRKEGTWIVDEMKHAYKQLHRQGFAHSIEVWDKERLVGGLYGIAINGFFSGESMFYLKTNASKVALVNLAQLLKSENIDFIDCQITNDFLVDMGSFEISREDFVQQKNIAQNIKLSSKFWQPRTLESLNL